MSNGYHFNPTLVPKILTEILTHLGVTDLESCRLVNTQWNEEACRILRKKKTVLFNGVQDLCEYVSRFSSCNEIHSPYPHSTFTFFVSIQREMLENVHPEIIDVFLKVFGSQVKSLHLSLEEAQFGKRHFKEILNEAFLPNLRTLSFIFSGSFGSKDRDLSRNLEKSRMNLPKLETLCLQIIGHDIVVNVDEVVRNLIIEARTLEKITYQIFGLSSDYLNQDMTLSEILINNVIFHPDVKLKKVKSLEYLMPVSDSQLLLLATKAFPLLEDCYLEILSNVQWGTLEIFFSVYAKTLKILHLDTMPANSICKQFEFFSTMPNLTYLSLESYEGSLKFTKLPALKSLVLKRMDVDRFTNLIEVNSHPNTVTSITFDNCSMLTTALASKLSLGFGNLKSIKFDNTTDEILHSIYSNLQILEELKVGGDEITDEGVCGLPPFVTKHVDVIVNLQKTAYSLRQLPFIGDLQNLKILELDSQKLSDASVVFGVSKCRNLRKLRLCCIGGLLTVKSIQETVRLPELSSAKFYVRKHGLLDMPMMRKVIQEFNLHNFIQALQNNCPGVIISEI